jgi:pimeloyl-ACP methyl ester carboxylesterase
MTKPTFARRAVLLAMCGAALTAALTFAAPSQAADAPPANRFAATLVPAERFEVGGVLVERHGAARGRPLILIPGLASGGWVWEDAVRAFAPSRPVYVLTLPGFDGRPAAGPAPLAAARAAVEQLIASRRLDRPVVVGHSLGGALGLQLAEERPQLLGGVVSIDGLPVMPGTEGLPLPERARFAEGMATRMTQIPPGSSFAAQQQAYMRTIGVLDMGKADDLAQLTSRSDPVSVGRYAADLLALDLRPGLKNIAAPVLVVMPYFDLDADQQGQTQDVKLGYYRALLEGTPNLQVVPVSPARHFAMFDQPQAVVEAIRTFVDKLSPAERR